MSNQLTFVKTVSISEFKTAEKATVIEVVKSPKTAKLFFTTDSGVNGAFSGDYDEVMANPAMSIVKGSTGEDFWMLHKKQSNNVLGTL